MALYVSLPRDAAVIEVYPISLVDTEAVKASCYASPESRRFCANVANMMWVIGLQIQHFYAHSPAFPSNMYHRTVDKYDLGYHHEIMIMPRSQDLVFNQRIILVSKWAEF